MKPRLIPNWRQAPRMLSMQAMSATVALIGAWQALPDEMRTQIPQRWVMWGAIALLVLGMVGRLWHQPELHPGEQP